jgi:radical SAM superfamily enzyme YgiQ (UPF0313 family)
VADIVLTTLNAKYIHAAFGLRYLLANLGELRARASLAEFDIHQRPLDIAEILIARNPQIIGFGVYIWNIEPTAQVIAAIKRVRPDIKIILGGPEVSYETESQAIVQLADHVITGEADLKFAEVCRALLGGAGLPLGQDAQQRVPTKEGKSPFVQLLEAVHEIEGLERIRFTSPHPKGYGDDLIEAYARLPRLVESAHLPVQSGSNRVLKLMHRGYTRERYAGIIEKLRRARPEIGITTDIIVGFPGETEDDFEQTLSLAREVRFDNAYIFKYSQRRDTPAADLPDQVPQKIREERNQRLLEVINEIGKHKYCALVGRRTEILVEGPSKKNPARLTGRTRCNKIVVFDGSERHRGQLLDVNITRAGSFTLYGDPDILD